MIHFCGAPKFLINFTKKYMPSSKQFSRTNQFFAKKNTFQQNTSSKPKSSPVIFLRATSADHDEIINLVNSSFIPYEPVCVGLGVTTNPLCSQMVYNDLRQGHSLIAKDRNGGQIVGAAINSITFPWSVDFSEALAERIGCEKTKAMIRFYADLTRAPDLFKKYNVAEIFEVDRLVVHVDYCGKGVGLELAKKSKELAKEMNQKLFRIDATSHYTSIICEKLLMQMVFSIPYSSISNENTEPILKIPNPHLAAKVYIQHFGK